MKLVAVTLLILGTFFIGQAKAEDVVAQPLTRAQCTESGMTWDDNANVCAARGEASSGQPLTRSDCIEAGMEWDDGANICGAASASATLAEPEEGAPTGHPLTTPAEREGIAATAQPLTRDDCDAAGMTWNESANVCGGESATLAASSILVEIDKAEQSMTVFVDGVQRHHWPVSTGGPGYATPSGSYSARSMNKIWYSRQWDNAPMPHAVFFTKAGHAIHGTNEVKRLGSPASHGCVRLAPENAATLYALVEENGLENTQVVLAGLTPGGETKISGVARSKPRYRADAWQPRRGRFLRRLFGRR